MSIDLQKESENVQSLKNKLNQIQNELKNQKSQNEGISNI